MSDFSDIQAIVRAAWSRVLPEVDSGIACAIVHHESNWNPKARSPITASDEKYGGAYGLAQILVATAHDLGYTGEPEGLYDPATNAWLLGELARRNARVVGKQAWRLIAAHNCGAKAVLNNKIPTSTRDEYVPAVLALYEKYYKTPADTIPPVSAIGPTEQSESSTSPSATLETRTPMLVCRPDTGP